MSRRSIEALREQVGYPVAPVPSVRHWGVPGYTAVDFVAESVKKAVPHWENPDLEQVWQRAQRLSAADELLRDRLTGRPLNPAGPTGIANHGSLYNLGPNLTADALVLFGDTNPYVLLQQRKDTDEWAFTGGYCEQEEASPTGYEDVIATSLRETEEETSVDLRDRHIHSRILVPQHVAKLAIRNTDNAWIEATTVLHRVAMTNIGSIDPKPGRDEKDARLFPLHRAPLTEMSEPHANIIYNYLQQAA